MYIVIYAFYKLQELGIIIITLQSKYYITLQVKLGFMLNFRITNVTTDWMASVAQGFTSCYGN